MKVIPEIMKVIPEIALEKTAAAIKGQSGAARALAEMEEWRKKGRDPICVLSGNTLLICERPKGAEEVKG